MRAALIGVLLLLTLAGCASAPYGALSPVPPLATAQMALDASAQLGKLYTPRQTQFEMLLPTTDSFGKSLSTNLRANGFGVLDYETAQNYAAAAAATHGAAPKAPAPRTVASGTYKLGYVIDRVDTGLYRVMLMAGDARLMRAYRETPAGFDPAGAWLRLE